jgi:hypothetical protein
MFGFQDKIAFPIFANVKHLELFLEPIYDVALVHLSSFMKACPRMQRLVLKVPIHTLVPLYIVRLGLCVHFQLLCLFLGADALPIATM